MAKNASIDYKGGMFALIKFAVFIVLIPFIAAVTISFQKELSELKTKHTELQQHTMRSLTFKSFSW